MKAIETERLTKRFGDKTAVDGLELSVEQGELFALLGVNGAGKTTTIKLLSCLCRPTGGDARLMSYSIVDQPLQVRELINVSPQETAVARNLSVRENLMLIAGVHGMSRAQSKERTRQLIEQFSLGEVAEKKAKVLSGGYQRRLSIAMALVSEPKILFLDEPTLGLDVIARRELWSAISALKGKVTIILTTHYMEEAEALSDRIGVMANGKLCALGTAQELMEQSGESRFEDAFIKLATGMSETREDA